MSGKTNYVGIDYGHGATNIDKKTGIRFGVINMNALVCESWEAFEADYGDPHCPNCGNDIVSYDDEKHCDYPHIRTGYRSCADYACESCGHYLESSDCFGDEPCGWTLDDGEYKATIDDYNDVFLVSSPYYTRAQFCSPCAPGAGYLENPCESGPRTYCFAADWFDDDNPCPYPVYRVDTGECVYTPPADAEE